MNDEPSSATEAGWNDEAPKDTWRNYPATGRLSVVLAAVTFCALFFPNMDKPWGLPVAIVAAYSVLVFSLAFRDKNCSLRRPQVRKLLPQFLLMHVPFLLLIYWIATLWIRLAPDMPDWLTVRGRKGSLYDWILTALLCLIAWAQEHWMRAIIKRSVVSNNRE